MEGLFMLLSLSIVMAIASFFAGSLPLSFSLTQSQLRTISTIGMGLLVGTSLIVIIPEGVDTLYNTPSSEHAHQARSMYARDVDVRWHTNAVAQGHWLGPRDKTDAAEAINALPGPVIPPGTEVNPGENVKASPKIPGEVTTQQESSEPPPAGEHSTEESHSHGPSHHAYVGISLVLGFILMYLIDQLPQHAAAAGSTAHGPSYISLDNLGVRHQASARGGGLEDGDAAGTGQQPHATRSFATTLGLVIHAAADGIALGASTSGSNTQLGLLIFVAIMVHKAPAAFGLTSVLLKQGLTKRQARAHLIIFSLAAPVGALATCFLLKLVTGGQSEGARTQWWTGILLLFSAGTFLYVAMHTMQEQQTPQKPESTNGYADGSPTRPSDRRDSSSSVRETLLAVVGMLLPLLAQAGHVH